VADMTSFRAEKCYHLVSAHATSPRLICSSVFVVLCRKAPPPGACTCSVSLMHM